MTTTAAENKAGHPGEKEKMEKRRALGRGLESLLPRPRVVASSVVPAGEEEAVDLRSPRQPGTVDRTSPASSAVTPMIPAVAGDAAETNLEGGVVAGLRSAPLDLRSGPAQPSAPPSPATQFRPAPSGSSVADETIAILAQAESRMPGNLVINLEIGDIDRNPFQTRHIHYGETLEELAESIKANGVVRPIVVRPAEQDGRYVLILGERRLHASKKAGKTTIPAIVRRVSHQQAAEMTIIENLQREDLSPLEQAEAFRILSQEFNLTQAQIGERVGLSRESISNYMRLLKLPREVLELLVEKRIKFAEAKELLKLDSDEQITKAALYAVKKGMTLEQIERLVLQMNGWGDSFPGMPGQERKKSGARWVDPNVRAAQLDLERLLGVRVKIRDRKGKGKIVIEYSTVDDYDRVVGMLRAGK